jgi:lipopolysaccharide transport system ATP-binding protein
MTPIIKVRDLGKRYRLGKKTAYLTIRERLSKVAGAPLRAGRAMLNARIKDIGINASHFWALRDLSFDVNRGEVLGIIGRNGAGKSTLLKILSRITEPTEGRVELHGRVGSLLEIGTGFHPELSGRQNLYLSGTILGMRRAEITRKFEEIVDFAGVEKFIDTPVKHYSSGMYVRLAFAVAAYLETEILLVDEVLAVGDTSFQKKCLGKMSDVTREGRTILFVSHNMTAIESLCRSAMLIDEGAIRFHGNTAEALTRYASSALRGSGIVNLETHPGRKPGSHPTMKAARMSSNSRHPSGQIVMSSDLSVRVEFSGDNPIQPALGVTVRTAQGVPVFSVSDRWVRSLSDRPPTKEACVECTIQAPPLLPGTYSVDLYLGDFGDPSWDLDVVLDALCLDVIPADVLGTGLLPDSSRGLILCKATWSLAKA